MSKLIYNLENKDLLNGKVLLEDQFATWNDVKYTLKQNDITGNSAGMFHLWLIKEDPYTCAGLVNKFTYEMIPNQVSLELRVLTERELLKAFHHYFSPQIKEDSVFEKFIAKVKSLFRKAV